MSISPEHSLALAHLFRQAGIFFQELYNAVCQLWMVHA